MNNRLITVIIGIFLGLSLFSLGAYLQIVPQWLFYPKVTPIVPQGEFELISDSNEAYVSIRPDTLIYRESGSGSFSVRNTGYVAWIDNDTIQLVMTDKAELWKIVKNDSGFTSVGTDKKYRRIGE